MKTPPLCVDLDGTLVFTDTLLEAFIKLVKKNPANFLRSIGWLVRGRAYFKQRISNKVTIDPALLPYNNQLITWLKQEKSTGRTLCLATGSDKKIAQAVADHLELFDLVLGSDGVSNLAGSGKTKALLEKFGPRGFDYAGNAKADLPVWKEARAAIVVNASPALTARAGRGVKVIKEFPRQRDKSKLRIFLREIRIHQWVKNLLLFVPLFTSHKVTDSFLLTENLVAFLAFSLTASAVYVFNDLLDLESDRAHPSKKSRPLARGAFSIDSAAITFVLLLLGGLALSVLLPLKFLYLILLYLLVNFAYSFWLKKIIWIDVFILAGFYVLRLLAGSAATEIIVSRWLFVFAALIFLSLALAKRASELVGLKISNKQKAAGRAYTHQNTSSVTWLGMASGYASIAVLGLYVLSTATLPLYSKPQILWLLLPLFFTWISRVWYLTLKGRLHEDPIVFAARDTWSYLTAAALVVIVWLAT